jgi:cell division protein FtsI (penicillin-binding protein 3)
MTVATCDAHGSLPSGDERPVVSRSALTALAVALAFVMIGGQLVRLALRGQNEAVTTLSQSVAVSMARPDIVDRNGRLLATDVEVPSLYADPQLVLDRDEVAEKLGRVLPGIDEAEVRRLLADQSRRFVWLRRGLSPRLAQAVHNLGLPGLAFRTELKRAYPAGRLAGHILGTVNIDNRGLAGLERHIDDIGLSEPVHGATQSGRAPLRASVDLGVQHALSEELRIAMDRYEASAAAGLVMDAATGELVAAQSLPDVDPSDPADLMNSARPDRLVGSVYEPGSTMKLITVAMALDGKLARRDTMLDVRQPLEAGRYTIRDPHPAGRPLSVEEVFVRSSNVGAGLLALSAGANGQRDFLRRLSLTDIVRTEIGQVAAPLLPPAQGGQAWGRIETITIGYGHGIAMAPVQLAAAAATLLNGGHPVAPTFIRAMAPVATGTPVISTATSRVLRDLMRQNVVEQVGTGRRADVPGYRVGGKTGTAEMAVEGGYKKSSVVSSFLAAFPIEAPRYVTLVILFEPKPTAAAQGQIAAGLNAAPTTARLVERIAPLLGVAATAAPVSQSDTH